MVRAAFLRIRGYHSLWHGIPADFCSENGYYPLHLLRRCRRRIQRDLSGFQSLLLTGSRCFLFLPLLRCFISGNCCTLTCAAKPRDRRLRASPPGLSQLAAWPCGPQPSHPLCGVANLHIATNKLTSVKISRFLQIISYDLAVTSHASQRTARGGPQAATRFRIAADSPNHGERQNTRSGSMHLSCSEEHTRRTDER
jgi:hypothetical protein